MSNGQNIGIVNVEEMKKIITDLSSSVNELDSSCKKCCNSFELFKSSFSGDDVNFLKDELESHVNNISIIVQNNRNQVSSLQGVMNAYNAQDQAITHGFNNTNLNL